MITTKENINFIFPIISLSNYDGYYDSVVQRLSVRSLEG